MKMRVKKIDLKLRKSSSSNGDISTFISKLSAGGGAEVGFEQIQGRLIGNGGSSVACLYTQQGQEGISQDAMIVWEEELLEFISVKEGFLHCKMSQRLHMCGCQTVTLQVWQWPARAFGDFCLKDFGLISVPDVYYHHITERDEFVLLASDGVLDVLSNKEAVDIVASAPSRATAGRALVDCATRAWRLKYPTSKNDNCAIVCLYLMRYDHGLLVFAFFCLSKRGLDFDVI
ncbi:hypothetical protein P3S68_018988 [Capsicum galapagoense]